MTHTSHSSAEPRSSWQRWTLASLVTATVLFGFWGNWKYEKAEDAKHPPDIASVFYHSCQFLIAHGVHLEGDVPWQLHVGRFLGVIALFTAGMTAFAKFFQSETLMWRLRAPWRRNHVLVCGLGDLGLRLALDARKRGKFVVAIEKHAEVTAIDRARQSGILVIEGDACDAATLRKVRVERAEFVVAACPEDSTNVAIAAIAGQVLPPTLQRGQPLVCRLLLRDPELRRLLAGHAVFDRGARPHSTPASVPNYRVNSRDLDLQEIAARQVLRQFPLDFQPIHQDDETTVHLVIVGFGPMGQDLALHAGRIGHFANGVPKDRRIRITVVDGDAKTKVDEFRTRHPKVDKVYDFLVPEADPTAPTFLTTLDDLSRESRERKELLTYAICFEKGSMANDRENLQIGIDLSRLTKDRPVQTLIYQSTRYGFAALFPAEAGGPALNTRLHAFGMIEEIYSWDVLLHESEDQVARAVHEVYAEYRRREKVIVDTWDVLPDGFKESNRHAADHIPVKLRALGYHDAPLQPGRSRIEDFSDEDVHLLAQMEHRRWCAERWLAGWEHGPETIRAKKISKDLVEWGDLTPEEQKKDYEQIHAIPEVLHGVGRGIYR